MEAEAEGKDLGGKTPKGLLSPCSSSRCRTSAEFSLFFLSLDFLSGVWIFQSVFSVWKCVSDALEGSPIYRLLVAFRRAFMTFMAIKSI